jgi:hypothetical protein
MIHIKGNLILEKDTTYEEDLKVDGNILGKDGNRYNLAVKGNINARNINAWNINARNIDAWNINARNINARNINAWDIDAVDIDAGNINARNIDAWNINARNINARNINARDIDAGDIDAGNINARNIDAWNINAGDINARNIDAGDISYYAVCFAYYNITCKSIKGRRDNCKHFVLDGEIKIKDDVEEIIEHNGRKYKLINELSSKQEGVSNG